MATTEAGGGVPSGELRERLIELADGLMNATWREDAEGLINAVLAEIAAAGVDLVPTERMRECEEAFDECYHDLNDCRGTRLEDER